MENFEQNPVPVQQTESEKKYFSKIDQIEEKYKDKKIFPLGEVHAINWSNLGKTLIVEMAGDVPTNFQQMNIVIVHPDSDQEGWIGRGGIGVTMEGNGTSISNIPLPREAIEMITDIYTMYTGQTPEKYQSFRMKDNGNDITQYAVSGLYNEILEKKNS